MTLAIESGQDLRTREVWITCWSHGHSDEGSEVPRVRPVQITNLKEERLLATMLKANDKVEVIGSNENTEKA